MNDRNNMRDTHYSRTNTTWFLVSKALKSWRMLAWFSWFITSISFNTISCQTRKSSTVHFHSPSPLPELKGRRWSKGSSTHPLFGSSGTDDLGCQSKPGFNLCAFVYFAEPTTKITEQSFNLCAFFVLMNASLLWLSFNHASRLHIQFMVIWLVYFNMYTVK